MIQELGNITQKGKTANWKNKQGTVQWVQFGQWVSKVKDYQDSKKNIFKEKYEIFKEEFRSYISKNKNLKN